MFGIYLRPGATLLVAPIVPDPSGFRRSTTSDPRLAWRSCFAVSRVGRNEHTAFFRLSVYLRALLLIVFFMGFSVLGS